MPNPTDTKIRFQLSTEQVKAIAAMVEDQVFRVKFIDPKLPGHKSNKEQLQAAESALIVIKESLQAGRPPSSDPTSRIVRKST